MLITLITGMLFTALGLGALWGGFFLLRRLSRFEHFNSRAANKRMLQLSLLFYFIGIALTIYWMA